MRLLITTQKIDSEDSVLGFFHAWVLEFAKKCENVIIICLEEGKHDLPSNVRVLSLGKEVAQSRLKYISRFYKYIWEERKNYDAVFVHMNPEYAVLGGLLWRIARKKIGFWYNHREGGILVRLGILLTHKLFSVSSYAFAASFKKNQSMPAGIDTKIFSQNSRVFPVQRSVLSLGRISPVKNLHVFVKALSVLDEQSKNFSAVIIGNAPSRDIAYFEDLHEQASPLLKSEKLHFLPAVPHPETAALYAKYELFVNLTNDGSYDKTILEAMAVGAIPLVSNRSLKGTLPDDLLFEAGNAKDLAEKISRAFLLPEEEKRNCREKFRKFISENHSLSQTIDKVMASY